VDIKPQQKVLDVCAGTNAIGVALLKREPTLDVHAMDRSAEMQAVGQENAKALGFTIKSTIGDVHTLPFPDNHFDVVTLQFASRHLRVREVFSEILRVLKPGGHFHHSDMLRPRNPIVKNLYYAYLRTCLNFTSLIVGSSPAATRQAVFHRRAGPVLYGRGGDGVDRAARTRLCRVGQGGYRVPRHARLPPRGQAASCCAIITALRICTSAGRTW
jgi:ubiquinone/menaquinone biosynthesis C-methylase UbiE